MKLYLQFYGNDVILNIDILLRQKNKKNQEGHNYG